MKILILGGYGVFGGRLATLLRDIPALDLMIAGRDLVRATAFCATIQGRTHLHPVALDRADLAAQIATLHPDLVVDASGPFQTYGDARYAVIETCIAARISYMDFADAADFVFGVSQFDAAARAAGIFVLSGVSSFPVLTAAVLREMAKDMQIETVRGGIAPSPFAGVGLNVMRAVVGYAGTPIKLTRNGAQIKVAGLTETMRYTIAVPGRVPLRNLHFSLVDVPDLQVLPPEHPSLRDIWMGAGPVPESLHRILNLLARLRARFNLPSYVPLAPLFYRILNLMKFGEHRGGMFVHATGTRDGQRVEHAWHLLAEGDDGPFIPSMAIEVLIRKCLAAQPPENGARPAINALSLADYDALFEGRDIWTGWRDLPEKQDNLYPSLYHSILGSAFEKLPTQVQALHATNRPALWRGMADVRRGTGPIANGIARMIGFPKAARATPVTLHFESVGRTERWTRTFGTDSFSSTQHAGTGRDAHLIVERFGWFRVALALQVSGAKLHLIPRRWSFAGVPLPTALLPRGAAAETESDGAFCFDIEVRAPLTGLIVAYKGWLKPEF